MRQSSSPGPHGSPTQYPHENNQLPQLARPDITNLTRTHASSKPDLTTSHVKPLDRPALARLNHKLVNSGSQPDITYMSSKSNSYSPEVSFLGSPKQSSDYQYQSNPDKLKDYDYISSYSPGGLAMDKSVNFDDFIPVSIV